MLVCQLPLQRGRGDGSSSTNDRSSSNSSSGSSSSELVTVSCADGPATVQRPTATGLQPEQARDLIPVLSLESPVGELAGLEGGAGAAFNALRLR